MKMKNICRLIFIVVSAFTLSACSSTPSSSNAEAVLGNNLEKQTKGIVKLIYFKKVNTQESELMGKKIFTIEFEAIIEFLEDCYWRQRNPIMDLPQSGIVVEREGGMFSQMFGMKKATTGQRETITGTLRFHKTEKGWRGEDGQVY